MISNSRPYIYHDDDDKYNVRAHVAINLSIDYQNDPLGRHVCSIPIYIQFSMHYMFLSILKKKKVAGAAVVDLLKKKKLCQT
ncbi:hypothetical protein DERF_001896, partial [Dermatophagoides farinae]